MTKKTDNLDKIDKFLEKYKLPKVTQKERNSEQTYNKEKN